MKKWHIYLKSMVWLSSTLGGNNVTLGMQSKMFKKVVYNFCSSIRHLHKNL